MIFHISGAKKAAPTWFCSVFYLKIMAAHGSRKDLFPSTAILFYQIIRNFLSAKFNFTHFKI